MNELRLFNSVLKIFKTPLCTEIFNRKLDDWLNLVTDELLTRIVKEVELNKDLSLIKFRLVAENRVGPPI